MFASQSGHLDVVSLLLEAGAEKDPQNEVRFGNNKY
jgi:ankyrin repeat protein